MSLIKPYNNEDKNLPTLFVSNHESGNMLINSAEFCENPKNGLFGIRDANEQVIKILPYTETISDDFLLTYKSQYHSSRGKEYCAYWKRNCQPYSIWGFYSKYRNYFPTDSKLFYLGSEHVYYWIDANTLVVQKIKAFKTLEQFLENCSHAK